jgi:hypothetical protein
MDYFYLKIGKGNKAANEWLAGKNPLNKPAVVIYFDCFEEKDYKSNKACKEAMEFYQRGSEPKASITRMVVIHEGEVLILKPNGHVVFLPSELNEEGNPHTPKAMPVEILIRKSMAKAPLVLAGITANRFLSSGTFRRITDHGNLKALDCFSDNLSDGDHWPKSTFTADDLLGCLGSTEMETLVAKCLEELGCFVPAYRGGNLKDIDLLAYNETGRPILFAGISLKKEVAVQVKRKKGKMKCPPTCDLLVGMEVVGERTVDGPALMSQVLKLPQTRNWLKRSLAWLPADHVLSLGL